MSILRILILLWTLPVLAKVTSDVSGIVSGRLTLTSGVPVTSADVSGSTIYFTPYNGAKISLYDGSRWQIFSYSELSLALGTLTNNTNYDVFIYANSGVPTLDTPVAWSTATARATAIIRQDGVYVKSGSPTRRYLGTFRTTSTTTTEDSAAKRFLWNYYNRQIRPLYKTNGTTTWSYNNSYSWRSAAGDSSYALHILTGLAESQLYLTYSQLVNLPTGYAYNGLCENCTDTAGSSNEVSQAVVYGTSVSHLESRFDKVAPLGYTYYTATELAGPASVPNFYGAAYGRLMGFLNG